MKAFLITAAMATLAAFIFHFPLGQEWWMAWYAGILTAILAGGAYLVASLVG